jgi:tol-pal system protein YbgF
MRIRGQLLLVAGLALLAVSCGSGGVREDPMMALSAEEALTKGKALMEAEKYRRAQDYLTHAFEVEPNSASGREGLLLAADALFLDGGSSNFIKAESKYRDFLNRFPTSDKAPYVQFQMANCLLKRLRKPDRDQSISRQALEAFGEVLQLYPDSEYATQAREQILVVRQNLAEHEFVVGRFNYRFKLFPAAVERFRTVVDEYPETEGIDRALFNLGLALLKVNQWQEAEDTFVRLRSEYPDSPYLEKIPERKPGQGKSEAAPEELEEPEVAGLLATGCSGLMPAREPEPDEKAEIKSRILELQRQAAMTRVEIDRLRQQVVALESKLLGGDESPPATTSLPPAITPPPADEPLPAPVPQEVEVSDLEPRREEPAPPSVEPSAPAPPPSAPVEGSVATPVSEAAQALYDRGYTLYHQGRYVDAEAGFRRFLQAYPETSLSDNAQYWIGESRFARSDFDGALAAFREAAQRYPGGNKVADSLLKAADCLQRLGDGDSARSAYDEVIRRFPGSAAAVMAEERRDLL